MSRRLLCPPLSPSNPCSAQGVANVLGAPILVSRLLVRVTYTLLFCPLYQATEGPPRGAGAGEPLTAWPEPGPCAALSAPPRHSSSEQAAALVHDATKTPGCEFVFAIAMSADAGRW